MEGVSAITSLGERGDGVGLGVLQDSSLGSDSWWGRGGGAEAVFFTVKQLSSAYADASSIQPSTLCLLAGGPRINLLCVLPAPRWPFPAPTLSKSLLPRRTGFLGFLP